MNKHEKYSQFCLVREMMDAPAIIRNFELKDVEQVIDSIRAKGRFFLTGEGSSRIFPAKNAIYTSLRAGYKVLPVTEGARQASEYDLRDFVIFGASNSGSTKEVIRLFDRLEKVGIGERYALTARENTKLSQNAKRTFLLSCGWEQAVAATKSVAEQGIFYQELLARINGTSLMGKFSQLADAIEETLLLEIPEEITERVADAAMIYFAGRNDGVAEELTLKTNEIMRKKSDYLEGTYAVHGIEEVMNPEDVVIFINPFDSELEKIKETLIDGIGLTVIAVSDKDTIFPTIKTKDIGELQNYVYLSAGWNILVEAGVMLGIDLDKAERARKVGNEFAG